MTTRFAQAPGVSTRHVLALGGAPGTCAAGRDSSSVACAECLEGRQEREDRTCGPCREGDYAFFVLVLGGFVGHLQHVSAG